jgi:hypothetical protein
MWQSFRHLLSLLPAAASVFVPGTEREGAHADCLLLTPAEGGEPAHRTSEFARLRERPTPRQARRRWLAPLSWSHARPPSSLRRRRRPVRDPPLASFAVLGLYSETRLASTRRTVGIVRQSRLGQPLCRVRGQAVQPWSGVSSSFVDPNRTWVVTRVGGAVAPRPVQSGFGRAWLGCV